MTKQDAQTGSASTDETKTDKREKSTTKTWDGTDESSVESFPASDSPTSWAGRDIPPQERKKS